MDPVSLKKCKSQLEALAFSPILGNKQMNSKNDKSKVQTRIPSFNQPTTSGGIKDSSGGKSSPVSQSASTKKRLFSETSPNATMDDGNMPKQIKMSQQPLDDTLKKFFHEMRSENKEQNEKLSKQLSKTEEKIDNKFDILSGQFSELKKKGG